MNTDVVTESQPVFAQRIFRIIGFHNPAIGVVPGRVLKLVLNDELTQRRLVISTCTDAVLIHIPTMRMDS